MVILKADFITGNAGHAKQIMQIEITPEMQRFNQAVERADFEFGSVCDRLTVEQLIASLRQVQLHTLASELEKAWRAISGNHAGE